MEYHEYKIGDIITEISMGPFGSDVKKEVYQETGVPILNGSNLMGYKLCEESFGYLTEEKADSLKKSNAHRGDVIVTHRGTLGQIVYVPEDSKYDRYVISQSQFRFTCNTDIVRPDYLVYYFHTREGQGKIMSNASQVGVPALARASTTFRQLSVPLPTREIQDKVMDIILSLDAKIETNNRINAKLEETAQALFKSWFVDFEPFRDQPFHETELGMIPEGWRVVQLGELVDNIGGYSYKGNELQPSSTAMATIKNFIRGGGFKEEGYKEIVPSDKLKQSHVVDLFDVLVAHTDLTQNAEVVGNPAIILSDGGYEKLVMSMDLTKVVPKHNYLSSCFIHSLLSTPAFKSHALGYVNGTTVLHMSKKAVPEYRVALPHDISIIQQMSNMLDPIYKRQSEMINENRRLAELRDTLLPKLMNGEIEI